MLLNLPKAEPLEMVKPNKEKIEAIKAKLEEADTLTLPSENDTEEIIKLRRSLLAKKYGDGKDYKYINAVLDNALNEK